MVSRLIRMKSDPEKKGRGAGLYYHRGLGVWSKYSATRDANKKPQQNRYKSKKPANKSYNAHKTDFRAGTKSKPKKTRARKGGRLGYF